MYGNTLYCTLLLYIIEWYALLTLLLADNGKLHNEVEQVAKGEDRSLG
jgi:hypothetical protein